MQKVVVVEALRSPIGSFLGNLSSISAPKIAAPLLETLVGKQNVGVEEIDQVYLGEVLTAGVGQAPARQALIYAGYPSSVAAVTVNKVCGSGMQTIIMAFNDIRVGNYSFVVAGGMESMSRAPHILLNSRKGYRLGNFDLIDSMIHDGLWDPYGNKHMGNCAEICVREYNISRNEQDDFALLSYERAREATEKGWFSNEIVHIKVKDKKEEKLVDKDEEPFRVDLSKLRSLRAVFEKEGTITAGNASKINDGAAALLITSENVARERELNVLATIVDFASHSQAPEWFTTAPAKAISKLLSKRGLSIKDIDLFEINEAFAVVALVAAKELDIPLEKLNIHGGAVALGHPIGASGARIVVTLIHALRRLGKKRGVASICIGGGEALALLVEVE